MKNAWPLISATLSIGCSEDGTIVGRVDGTLPWVSHVEALTALDVMGTDDLDADGAFEIQVSTGETYRLRLVDRASGRGEFVVFPSGDDSITIREGGPVDVGAISAATEDRDPVSTTDPDTGICRIDPDRCEFETYNLDVHVGDRFIVSNFMSGCGRIGTDVVFDYPDGETWNLDNFNNNQIVEITEADINGGNHGDGEYRVFLFTASGDEIDHMTIRIGHDAISDVGPGDDAPPANAGPCDGIPTACTASEDCSSGVCVDGFCTTI